MGKTILAVLAVAAFLYAVCLVLLRKLPVVAHRDQRGIRIEAWDGEHGQNDQCAATAGV